MFKKMKEWISKNKLYFVHVLTCSFYFIIGIFLGAFTMAMINEKDSSKNEVNKTDLSIVNLSSNETGSNIIFDASHIQGDMSFTLNTSLTYWLYPETAQVKTEGAPYYGKYFYISAKDGTGWYDHEYAKVYLETSSQVVRYNVNSPVGDIGIYEFLLNDFILNFTIENGGWYQFVHTFLIHYELYKVESGEFIGEPYDFITQNDFRFNVIDSSYLEGYNAGYSDGYEKGFLDGKNETDNEAWQRGYNDGYNRGLIDGYENGYSDGLIEGENVGYEQGYISGKEDGKLEGYNNGYNAGYSDGIVNNPSNNFGDMIIAVLVGVGTVLSIELLPNISIGAIIAVPIVFGIIAFVLGRKKE